MSKKQKGKLVIVEVPEGDARQEIVSYLSSIIKNASIDQLTEKTRQTPIVFNRGITSDVGYRVIKELEDLGALALFVPDDPDDTEDPGETENAKEKSTLETNMPYSHSEDDTLSDDDFLLRLFEKELPPDETKKETKGASGRSDKTASDEDDFEFNLFEEDMPDNADGKTSSRADRDPFTDDDFEARLFAKELSSGDVEYDDQTSPTKSDEQPFAEDDFVLDLLKKEDPEPKDKTTADKKASAEKENDIPFPEDDFVLDLLEKDDASDAPDDKDAEQNEPEDIVTILEEDFDPQSLEEKTAPDQEEDVITITEEEIDYKLFEEETAQEGLQEETAPGKDEDVIEITEEEIGSQLFEEESGSAQEESVPVLDMDDDSQSLTEAEPETVVDDQSVMAASLDDTEDQTDIVEEIDASSDQDAQDLFETESETVVDDQSVMAASLDDTEDQTDIVEEIDISSDQDAQDLFETESETVEDEQSVVAASLDDTEDQTDIVEEIDASSDQDAQDLFETESAQEDLQGKTVSGEEEDVIDITEEDIGSQLFEEKTDPVQEEDIPILDIDDDSQSLIEVESETTDDISIESDSAEDTADQTKDVKKEEYKQGQAEEEMRSEPVYTERFEKQPEVIPAAPSQKNWKGIAIGASATTIFVAIVSFLVWSILPYLTQEDINTPPPEIHYIIEPPLVLNVAPKEMYKAHTDQFSIRPDKRFVDAFEGLIDMHARMSQQRPQENQLSMMVMKNTGNKTVIRLLKNKKAVSEISMPLPMDFSITMSKLEEWLKAIEAANPVSSASPMQSVSKDDLKNAAKDISLLDPLSTINYLSRLDNISKKQGPHPEILKESLKGYTMLLMGLTPDIMDRTSNIASHCLDLLAMAKHLDPSIPLSREEALLAMNMGYKAHTDTLIKKGLGNASDHADSILEAYMKMDLGALQSLQKKNPGILGQYLLARMYRELGSPHEAQKEALALANDLPAMYPTAVEIIYSGDVNIAKTLTTIYPLDIASQIMESNLPDVLTNRVSWEKQVKLFHGTGKKADISWAKRFKLSQEWKSYSKHLSLRAFNTNLNQWKPFEEDNTPGLIIDEGIIKSVFRTMFSDALALRYHLFKNRMQDLDITENYIKDLSEKDRENPLVMELASDLFSTKGKTKEADDLCLKVIHHPDTSIPLTSRAFFSITDPATRVRLEQKAIKHLDGSPENLRRMGAIQERIKNMDTAASFYTNALSANPFNYSLYNKLVKISGSNKSIVRALKKYPDRHALMINEGDYFAQKKDKKSREKALKYYNNALRADFVPTDLLIKKAVVLEKLGRYKEAIKFMREWIEKYSKSNRPTSVLKAELAKMYIVTNKPETALEVLKDDLESTDAGVMMILGDTYEAMNNDSMAEKVYLRAISRHPKAAEVLVRTASFFWRKGDNNRAAKIIAKQRISPDEESIWYFDEFTRIFAKKPVKDVYDALGSLLDNNIDKTEVSSLCTQFSMASKRPEIAYTFLQRIKLEDTAEIERIVDSYIALKKYKGKKQAQKYIHKALNREHLEALVLVFHEKGQFDLILDYLDKPQDFPMKSSEYLWLQKVAAWIALGKKPSHLRGEITVHYQIYSRDYHHTIGRYLTGMATKDQLLGMMQTPRQRCEFSYYIGLSERLRGNYEEAAKWYQLCLETLLKDTNEYNYALEELSRWSRIGTNNRNRMITEDIKDYYERY